jgi:NAD+ diphosphatase
LDHFTRSSLNGFGSSNLDRLSIRRKDDAWVAEKLRDADSRFLPVWHSKQPFSDGVVPSPVMLSPVEARNLIEIAELVIFLGEDGRQAYFALGLPPLDSSLPEALAGHGTFQDLRTNWGFLQPEAGTLLAYARAIVHWHGRNRFCSDCGSVTESRSNGHLRVCTNPACGAHHFPRTDPAIIVLVCSESTCLLGRQPAWTKGVYSTIAGFVEPGETIEAAVAREVMEETGISLAEIHYHSSQPWPFPGSIMLGFTALASSHSISLNDQELEDARWFSREDLEEGLLTGSIRLPTRISIAFRLIEDWFDSKSTKLLRDLVKPARQR